MLITVLLSLFLFSRVEAAPRCDLAHVLERLQILEKSQIFRTKAEIRRVRDYKNHPERQKGNPPVILDLAQSAGEDFKKQILLLRKGDSVQVGARIIRLGEFLGAGSQTHIFACADNPKQVIRIPYSAEGIGPARMQLRAYRQAAAQVPEEVRRVKIFESDPEGKFLIVSRIWGSEDGREFLGARPAIPSSGWLAREKALKDLTVKMMVLFLADEPYALRLQIIEKDWRDQARQFVWDEKLKRWILADWESF
ncbi:hypothetical protein WDW37_03675 [Bdellovibrionota bacterium FG-1]